MFNGKKLKNARQSKKYSMQYLADLIKSSKSHIWEMENGITKNPTLNTVSRLADALDKPLTFFIDDLECVK